jgi:hypothetical protein
MGRANDLLSLAPMAKSTLSQSAGVTAPHPRLSALPKCIGRVKPLQYSMPISKMVILSDGRKTAKKQAVIAAQCRHCIGRRPMVPARRAFSKNPSHTTLRGAAYFRAFLDQTTVLKNQLFFGIGDRPCDLR